MTTRKTKIAIVYDFDRTLSTSEMQDSFIRNLGMEPREFWDENSTFSKDKDMDKILSYLNLMKDKSYKMNKPFNRDVLNGIGSNIEFFEGVIDWFDLIDEVAVKYHVSVEHYLISSGLKEIILGTPIAKKFKEIYACEYLYDANDSPIWLKNVVNFTTKTQFLFRISKGALDISDDEEVNSFSSHEERPIPFENMIYIGDGNTDVPCMKLVKQYGGYSIGVYSSRKKTVHKLMYDDRITHFCKADYRKDSDLFNLVSNMIHKISVDYPLRMSSYRQYRESAKKISGQ